MAYSFTNPVVDAKIWSPTDGTVELSIWGEEPSIPYVQSVRIMSGMAWGGEIEIELSPPRDEAIRILDETSWLKLGNMLAVRWGYNDGQPGHLSDWIYGMMLMPDLSIAEEISLTIKANTFGLNADRSGSTKTWSKPGAKMSRLDIIKEICKKYGFVFSISEGEGNLPPAGLTDQEILLLDPREDIIQAGLTDLQFLYKMVLDVGGDMSLVGNKLVMYLDPKKSIPSAEFHMYGKIDPAKNIFPLLSFSPESMGPLFLPSVSYTTAMYSWNADPFAIVERVAVTGAASAGEAASDSNFYSGEGALETPGADLPAEPDSGIKLGVFQDPLSDVGKDVPLVFPVEMIVSEAKAALQGVMDGNAEDYGIKASITSLAIPTLLVNQTVRLRGVSRFFSCDYKVQEIEVSIDDGGAEMELALCAKGVNPEICLWAEIAKKSETGDTQPGDGGEDVPADSGAGA